MANVHFCTSGSTVVVSITDPKSSIDQLPISSAEEARVVPKILQRTEDCKGTSATNQVPGHWN